MHLTRLQKHWRPQWWKDVVALKNVSYMFEGISITGLEIQPN